MATLSASVGQRKEGPALRGNTEQQLSRQLTAAQRSGIRPSSKGRGRKKGGGRGGGTVEDGASASEGGSTEAAIGGKGFCRHALWRRVIRVGALPTTRGVAVATGRLAAERSLVDPALRGGCWICGAEGLEVEVEACVDLRLIGGRSACHRTEKRRKTATKVRRIGISGVLRSSVVGGRYGSPCLVFPHRQCSKARMGRRCVKRDSGIFARPRPWRLLEPSLQICPPPAGAACDPRSRGSAASRDADLHQLSPGTVQGLERKGAVLGARAFGGKHRCLSAPLLAQGFAKREVSFGL